MLRRGGSRILHRPDWVLLRKLGKVAAAHNWLNLALQTPPRIFPLLVTIVVSPSANAAFYVAWMLINFLFMVPASLSTVLFAIVSAAPEVIAEKLRFVLRLSLLIGVPAMIVLAVGAKFALGLFGASYAQVATVPLLLLIVTYIPGLAKTQYIAVCRATNRVSRAAVVLTIAALCELAAVVIGGKLGGLDGLSLGYLGVTIVEGIVTAPTVLRAAYARGVSQPASGTEPKTTLAAAVLVGPVGPVGGESGYVHGQEVGLVTLMTLAAAAVSEAHTLDATVEVWRADRRPIVSVPGQGGHRHRTQADLDALIARATPGSSDEDAERPGQPQNH
jgi:hypothetical protein